MDSITSFLSWLEASDLSTGLQQSAWAFPTVESTHVLAISMVLGTIVVLDLRLIGLASVDRAVGDVARVTLPITWGAFLVALTTGSLMFTTHASDYFVNFFFRSKMLFLALAACNMLVFHFLTGRAYKSWAAKTTPAAGRIAGLISIACWITVLFMGREIGFSMALQ